MSHAAYGAISLVALVVVVYFGFTKAVPFEHGVRLNADPTAFGGPGLFGDTVLPPLGTRPRYPGTRPPYRPDVPCASQTPPNLTAPAGPPLEMVGTP